MSSFDSGLWNTFLHKRFQYALSVTQHLLLQRGLVGPRPGTPFFRKRGWDGQGQLMRRVAEESPTKPLQIFGLPGPPCLLSHPLSWELAEANVPSGQKNHPFVSTAERIRAGSVYRFKCFLPTKSPYCKDSASSQNIFTDILLLVPVQNY